jgi:hypothetical protein
VSVFSGVIAHVDSSFNHFQSVIHDPSARITAISALYEEIDAAEQLLSLRNALAPISLLPPEVLARVFYLLSLLPVPASPPLPSTELDEPAVKYVMVVAEDELLAQDRDRSVLKSSPISLALAAIRSAPKLPMFHHR